MRSIALLAGLLCASAAIAADLDQPAPYSPYDTSPKCTERNADGNAPECILQTEGQPRHT